ncbi:MAG TPA: lytic transglycosylase domain-containing protein, partial [Croceibacterium sp.]|nr:lytic transglycosylase domain-containing protein [Croceibacterium sp.]
MKHFLLALGAATALGAVPAAAQPTHEYYQSLAARTAAPRQLSQDERNYYAAVFAAIDRQDWTGAEALLAQRADGLLHPVARGELYLAANSPRVELPQIEAWLPRGRELPQAQQLARLAMTRGATTMPDLPYAQQFYATGSSPKRTRPRSVDDGTMPATVREAILARIDADDSDGARVLLDGIDALLSAEARAEWRQRVAWSYYIENLDAQALGLAATVGGGSGPWVAEGDWTMGLA